MNIRVERGKGVYCYTFSVPMQQVGIVYERLRDWVSRDGLLVDGELHLHYTLECKEDTFVISAAHWICKDYVKGKIEQVVKGSSE